VLRRSFRELARRCRIVEHVIRLGTTTEGRNYLPVPSVERLIQDRPPHPVIRPAGSMIREREGLRRDVLMYLLSILRSIGVLLAASSYSEFLQRKLSQ